MTDAAGSKQVELRRMTAGDVPIVSRRLAETFTNATAAQWETLFAQHWPDPPVEYGVVAVYEGRIVGFFGYLASVRIEGGVRTRCRNTTSWWVDPEMRGLGIGRRIIDEVVAEGRDVRTIILTLPEGMMDFWRKQPIRPFDRQRRVHLGARLRPALFAPAVRVLPAGIYPDSLPAEAKRILTDHAPLRCRITVFEAGGQSCGVVTRRRSVQIPDWNPVLAAVGRQLRPAGQKRGWQLHLDRAADLLSGRWPCAEVFYVSDTRFFRRHVAPIARQLCRGQRALALLGDAVRLGLDPARGISVPSEYYVFQQPDLDLDQVDALYSEFFVHALGDESR